MGFGARRAGLQSAHPNEAEPVTLDLVVLAVVALFAVAGYMRGFTAQVISLLGVALGLFAGAWIAPLLLPDAQTDWLPLASLLGAAAGATVLGFAAGRLAAGAQLTVLRVPGLGLADRIAGALIGGLLALALAWAFAVLLLQQPSLGLRNAVQRSSLLPTLVESVPPNSVLRTLEGIDPLPILPQLIPRNLPEPDPSVLRSAGARVAARSVVKVEGSSCGLGIQGTGWVLQRTLVATNAHVVSGERDTRVLTPEGLSLSATVVYRNAGDDVAILRVDGLTTPVLPTDEGGDFPRPVVLLGYPGDGALVATAGTAGSPRRMLVPNADDSGVGLRRVVPLRGKVRHGESGGPVVDRRGRVVAMIFGGTRGGQDGFAVPVDTVLDALEEPLQPVDAGPCAG